MIEVIADAKHLHILRNIENRLFKNGKWLIPKTENNIALLQKYNIIPNDAIDVKKNEIFDYVPSKFLYKYQKSICNDALNKKQFAIFSDTGTGKTIMGLEISKQFKRTLIICPLNVINTAWIEDAGIFYKDLSILNLYKIPKEKRNEYLKKEYQIYVINFDGFKANFNDFILSNFDCIIIDESTCMRSMKSQITGMLLQIADKIPFRFILSGCPNPNHNSELYPQMKFVNAECFGNNYFGFMAKYFTQDQSDPHNWYQTEENKLKFFDRLKNYGVFLAKDDCLDLPEKIFNKYEYQFENEQAKYYNAILKSLNNDKNILTKFEFTARVMKLRQILSGMLINKDGSITEFETGKDKILTEIIDNIKPNKQIIIWCQFIHTIKRLESILDTAIGITSEDKNKDKIIEAFKDNKFRILIAHPKLLGKGQRFVNCSHTIYYDLSYSYEEFKQTQDRIHRNGQTEKCNYSILISDNIDKIMYDCLINKKSVVDELYNNLLYDKM
jgi:superfamily II DNA or RNA helicase